MTTTTIGLLALALYVAVIGGLTVLSRRRIRGRSVDGP